MECIAERVGGEWRWLWIGGYFLSYGEDRAEDFLRVGFKRISDADTRNEIGL